MTKPRIALISGSTRGGSINKNLVSAMALVFKDLGVTPVKIDLNKYDMPIYNGDYEAANGVPKTAKNLIRRLKGCDGVFIATPEYNGCMPALLKNTIDWTTRVELGQFTGPIYSIGAATPGGLSGIMALKQLHFILTRLGANIVSSGLGVGFAGKAFDKKGRLADERTAARAQAMAEKMLMEIKRRK